MPPASFRTVTLEANAHVACKDFTDGDAARRYSDDAASGIEDGHVLSYVLDDRLEVVHVGKHY